MHAHALKTARETLIMIVGALFDNKIVETLENKIIHTPPFSPPVKVVVFVGSLNSSTMLHRGDGEGKPYILFFKLATC